ncbi:MAG: periplasmic heavy metal sensor [Candidatus Omnitrophota bacterium]
MLLKFRDMVLGAVFMAVFMPAAAMAAEPKASVESLVGVADEDLGLTPEQKNEIKAVRDEFKTIQQALRENLSRKNEALRLEMDADKPDRAKADAVVIEIKALQGRIVENRVDVVFKLRDIYTPAQMKIMKRRLEDRQQVSVSRKAVMAKPGKLKKQEQKKK